MSLRRTVAIVRKEMLHIIRDPRNLFLVTLSPAFLLFLLAYLFAFEVSHVNLAILDLDRSHLSRKLVASLTNDQELRQSHVLQRYSDILPLLVGGHTDAALVIPPKFGQTIQRGEPAPVQAIVDGTDPYAGSAAIGTMQAKAAVFAANPQATGDSTPKSPIQIQTQAWYNPGRDSLLSMVPGLMAIVLVMPTLALSLALTREKESGTLEGLMATPVSGLEYTLGKVIAYGAPGLLSAILALMMAVFWFQVPFRGSLAVYLVMTSDYFLACMGATVLIAHFAQSQQTAMFIVLLVFLVPSFFLAGLATPVSTTSLQSMLISYALPSTHFVGISRIIFLKGLGFDYLREPGLILLIMGLGAVTVGLLVFRKKIR